MTFLSRSVNKWALPTLRALKPGTPAPAQATAATAKNTDECKIRVTAPSLKRFDRGMFVVFVPFQGFRLAPLTTYILSNDEIVAKDAVLDEDFTAGKDAERERLASCGGGRSRNFRFKTITRKPAERGEHRLLG
jgi:hypothetical protein